MAAGTTPARRPVGRSSTRHFDRSARGVERRNLPAQALHPAAKISPLHRPEGRLRSIGRGGRPAPPQGADKTATLPGAATVRQLSYLYSPRLLPCRTCRSTYSSGRETAGPSTMAPRADASAWSAASSGCGFAAPRRYRSPSDRCGRSSARQRRRIGVQAVIEKAKH